MRDCSMSGERVERFTGRFRPPREATLREALEAQPEALPIIDQEFESSDQAQELFDSTIRERLVNLDANLIYTI